MSCRPCSEEYGQTFTGPPLSSSLLWPCSGSLHRWYSLELDELCCMQPMSHGHLQSVRIYLQGASLSWNTPRRITHPASRWEVRLAVPGPGMSLLSILTNHDFTPDKMSSLDYYIARSMLRSKQSCLGHVAELHCCGKRCPEYTRPCLHSSRRFHPGLAHVARCCPIN